MEAGEKDFVGGEGKRSGASSDGIFKRQRETSLVQTGRTRGNPELGVESEKC